MLINNKSTIPKEVYMNEAGKHVPESELRHDGENKKSWREMGPKKRFFDLEKALLAVGLGGIAQGTLSSPAYAEKMTGQEIELTERAVDAGAIQAVIRLLPETVTDELDENGKPTGRQKLKVEGNVDLNEDIIQFFTHKASKEQDLKKAEDIYLNSAKIIRDTVDNTQAESEILKMMGLASQIGFGTKEDSSKGKYHTNLLTGEEIKTVNDLKDFFRDTGIEVVDTARESGESQKEAAKVVSQFFFAVNGHIKFGNNTNLNEVYKKSFE